MAAVSNSELPKSVTFHDFSDLNAKLSAFSVETSLGLGLSQPPMGSQPVKSVKPKSGLKQSKSALNAAEMFDERDEITQIHSNPWQEQREAKTSSRSTRRVLPLNTSFSTWLQMFLSKKRRG